MKKRCSALAILLTLLLLLAACGSTEEVANQAQAQAEASGLTLHKIGVPVYNLADAEVMMFRDYLENYIGGCFDDVTFLYSESITGEEELLSFLSTCAGQGVEGILSFVSYDLEREVSLCAENKMYYIRAAGTTSDAQFEAVADDPWFLGVIGPGAALEAQASADMVRALAHADDGQNYLILSGGAALGNEMHRLRTVAILETLEEVYGVTFAADPETLAAAKEPTDVTAGALRLTICPGFVSREPYQTTASQLITDGGYDLILSTVAVTPLMDALKAVDIRCGVVDCFSEDNYFGFQKGKIAYVAGKYRSEIGPAFAALYNAICGNGADFREDGRAFRLEQGFWTAPDADSYNEMYGLSSGISINAYSYEDLYSVVKTLHPEASLDDLKALVSACSYEDCLARRGGE